MISGGTRSGRVLATCPSLMNVAPRCSRVRRSARPAASSVRWRLRLRARSAAPPRPAINTQAPQDPHAIICRVRTALRPVPTSRFIGPSVAATDALAFRDTPHGGPEGPPAVAVNRKAAAAGRRHGEKFMEYSEYQHLTFKHFDDGVLLLTLNRPAVL